MPRVFQGSILLGFIAFFALGSVAEPTAVGQYKDWRVYVDTDNGEKVCFATTKATDMAPRSANHGDVWFYVTKWARSGTAAHPSLKVGYDLRSDLPPEARIGRATWTLYSAGPEAFVHDNDETSVLSALKRGSELRVEAVSSRDTPVAYHFSLAGSSAAIDKARSVCR